MQSRKVLAVILSNLGARGVNRYFTKVWSAVSSEAGITKSGSVRPRIVSKLQSSTCPLPRAPPRGR